MSENRERRRRRRDNNAKVLHNRLFRQRVVDRNRRRILNEIRQQEAEESLNEDRTD